MATGLIIVGVLILLLGGYLGFSIYRYRSLLTNSQKAHSKYLITLNDRNFSKVISSGITLVDFWAAWCKPCVFLAPIVSQLADDYQGKVTVAKFDVEASRRVPAKLRIMNIPTVIIFKNGKEIHRIVGVKPYNYYKKLLDRLLVKT